jgi:hypothetical protein
MSAFRERLPNRRNNSITFGFEHRAIRYTATVNFFSDGRLAEIFIDCCGKPGSALAEHVSTASILASLLLQHHVAAETIAHSISGPLATALAKARELRRR